MNASTLLSTSAFVLGLASLAIVLTRSEAPAEVVGGEAGVGIEALAAQVASLEADVDSLRRQLGSAELAPLEPVRSAALRTDAASSGDLVTREEFDEWKRSLAAAQNVAGGGAGSPAAIERQVAEALDAVTDDRMMENALAKHEKRAARTEARTAVLSKWLQLDENQSSLDESFMVEQDARDLEALNQWKAGALDLNGVDETRAESSRLFRESLRGVLSPAQFDTLSQKYGDGK